MKKRIYTLIIMFVFVSTSIIFAHPGRLDSKGGHRDNKNVSGLGSYHYHCGNSPAHLHENGICPYGGITQPTTTTPKQPSTNSGTKVIVNNILLDDAYAIKQDGRTLVAIRPIFESLGATLSWDAKTKTVTGIKSDDTIQLIIGNKIAKINGSNIELDVPGKIYNGRTLVPARFIAESLGATVDFNAPTNSVIISTQ